VHLVYRAKIDNKVVAAAPVDLTFGPASGTSMQVLAPAVAPVTTGPTIDVAYDLRGVEPIDEPELVVTHPGRIFDPNGGRFTPALTIPLEGTTGTVQVPTSALDGSGIYGIGVHYADEEMEGFLIPLYSDFAYTRLRAAPVVVLPAPTVAREGGAARHSIALPYSDRIAITWDVRSAARATGARIEISAPGPTLWNLLSTFSNPEGSRRDRNGLDSPSVRVVDVAKVRGAATFAPDDLGLVPGMTQGVRVLPIDASGRVVGSASAVSTVTRRGLTPSTGGSVEQGFSIDPAGGSGLLTADHVVPGDPISSSVEVFDQKTLAITAVPLTTVDRFYTSVGTGVFGGHAGLVAERDPLSFDALAAWRLDDVADADPKPWSVPKPARYRLEAGAADATTPTGAFLLRDTADGGSGPYRLTFGNVSTGVFGPVIDISASFDDLPGAPEVRQIAYSAEAGYAVLTFMAAGDPYAPPLVLTVEETTGTVTPRALDTIGMPMGLDVLASPARAVISTFDYRLSVLDLTTGAARSIAMPGSLFGQYVAADDEHGQFLVFQPAPADIDTNHNALSEVYVFDPDLVQLDVINRFNFYDTPLSPRFQQLQVDPRTRTGWTVGRLQGQLVPFRY
jgi:hypothetical protein